MSRTARNGTYVHACFLIPGMMTAIRASLERDYPSITEQSIPNTNAKQALARIPEASFGTTDNLQPAVQTLPYAKEGFTSLISFLSMARLFPWSADKRVTNNLIDVTGIAAAHGKDQ